jgi:hypothetical protein
MFGPLGNAIPNFSGHYSQLYRWMSEKLFSYFFCISLYRKSHDATSNLYSDYYDLEARRYFDMMTTWSFLSE